MKYTSSSFFLVILFLFPLLNAVSQAETRPPLEVNLIVDGSRAFTDVKEEVTEWILNRLDLMLSPGDRIFIYSAGSTASLVHSGTISSNEDKEEVRNLIRELSASPGLEPGSADFAGALLDASRRQGTGINYTLLVTATPGSLSSLITGPNAHLVRFSRVEEFPGWRAFVVALNINSRVRNAASRFAGS